MAGLYGIIRGFNSRYLMDIQEALIRACIEGDRRAEYELFKISNAYLMSICRRYVTQPERAQEIFNMGFYKILRNLKSYNQDAPFKPWARAIMVNTIINEYKKEKVHYANVTYLQEYELLHEQPDMNEGLEKLDTDYIYFFIAQLPTATQHVFNLYLDGFKHPDIAALLRISESTSRWHVTVAKARLRELIRNRKSKSTIAP